MKAHPLKRAALPLAFSLPLVLLGPACPPAPVPPTSLDAGAVDAAEAVDAGECVLVCAHLRAIGCPEGADGSKCETTCDRVQAAKLTDLRTSCLLRAKSKEEARACGSVHCF